MGVKGRRRQTLSIMRPRQECPNGGYRVKWLFITLLHTFDGTRGKQARAHSLPAGRENV